MILNVFCSLVDITYKWGTYSSKWVMEYGTIFKTFLNFTWCLYIFSNISMPFLRSVNHVPRMRMEINRMNKQDEVVPNNV